MNTQKERSGVPADEVITDRSEVLGKANPAHTNPAGGKVVSCNLDEACVQVDCEQLAEEIESVLDESPEAPDYVMHYCGVEYLKQTPEKQASTQADTQSGGGQSEKKK